MPPTASASQSNPTATPAHHGTCELILRDPMPVPRFARLSERGGGGKWPGGIDHKHHERA